MRRYCYTILILLFWGFAGSGFSQTTVKQGGPVPSDFCISQTDMRLYRMINDYRKRYGLPAVSLSRSLCYVAITHVKDLFINNPDKSPCNFHSWSDQGTWKPFCYPRDENKKNSVWDKPKELTRYPGKGYEIIYWENNPASIDSIMSFWKSESYFNGFLLNRGKWLDKKWKAIGIAIYENYASVWFGEAIDPEGSVVVCGSEQKAQIADTHSVVRKKLKEDKAAEVAVTEKNGGSKFSSDSLGVKQGYYYIIVKSNLPFDVAEKTVKTLAGQGYPNAKILEKDGKARVSVYESSDRIDVMAKLKEVKRKFRDAWMLKL